MSYAVKKGLDSPLSVWQADRHATSAFSQHTVILGAKTRGPRRRLSRREEKHRPRSEIGNRANTGRHELTASVEDFRLEHRVKHS